MENHNVSIFTRNPVVWAEAMKCAREACGQCTARLYPNELVIGVKCTHRSLMRLQRLLTDVISPKVFTVC